MGRFYLALLKRSFKLWMILMLVVLIFSFGHIMTPREPDAFARVYLDAADSLSSPGVPEYMKFQVDEGKVQEVYLNDNRLFYTLNRTDKTIPQLLDYYENLYSVHNDRVLAEPEAIEAMLKTVPDKKSRDEHRRQIAKTEEILNDRFIRFEGEGWGGFSTIVTGKEADPDYTEDLRQRFMELKETGLASSLGDTKMVVAFEDPSNDSTQYFNVWPDEGFDLRKMRPQGGEDSPGFDIDDIKRPMGSRRLITFAQNHGGVRYSVLVYQGRGNTASVLGDFAAEMITDAWAPSAAFERARAASDSDEPALLMVKGGREAYISLRADRRDGTVTSTIIVYDHGG
jgi:hypothetical protein